jgi:hypothetical protein
LSDFPIYEHGQRRSEQETRIQGEASRKALLKGLERTIKSTERLEPDSPRCKQPRHEDANPLLYRRR